MPCSDHHDRDLTFLLLRAGKLTRDLVRQEMADIGLQRAQGPCLGAIGHHEGIAQVDLARHLNITPATLTNILHGLERLGLIERRKHPEDERKSCVYLTPTGRETFQRGHDRLRAINAELTREFGPEVQAQLAEHLKTWTDTVCRKLGRPPCCQGPPSGQTEEKPTP